VLPEALGASTCRQWHAQLVSTPGASRWHVVITQTESWGVPMHLETLLQVMTSAIMRHSCTAGSSR
jgi:hypothetical protein